MDSIEWPHNQEASSAKLLDTLSVPAAREDMARLIFVVRRRPDSTWAAMFGRIDVAPDAKLPEVGSSLDFGELRVLRERVSAEELLTRVREAVRGGHLLCDGVAIPNHALDQPVRASKRYSDEPDYASGWPCLDLQTREFPDRPPYVAGPLYGPPEAPFFGGFDDLIGAVSEFQPYHGHRDARRNLLTIVLWDTRARFASVEVQGAELQLKVEADEFGAYQILGQVKSSKEARTVSELAATTLLIPLLPDPAEVRIDLVRNREAVDRRYELSPGLPTERPPGETMAQSAERRSVFYSWQSDVRAAACRTLIERALEEAVKRIARDSTIAVEPAIDRDTQDVPGAPDIGATILAKIDAAAAFVADVTLVGKTDSGKATPNPNVLIELGYALKTLGWSRIILVQNTAFGGPELLPFDLRQKRTLTFASAANATERAADRRVLADNLRAALVAILRERPPIRPDVELRLDHEVKHRAANVHLYELSASLKNTGAKRLDDWYIEVEFPTPLLDDTVYGSKVESRSNGERSVFRAGSDSWKKPLLVGDSRAIKLNYRVTEAIYERREELFGQLVVARAFVDGLLVDTVERPMADLQEF